MPCQKKISASASMSARTNPSCSMTNNGRFASRGALLHKSRHEDSLYESSVIAGGYEQLDTYEV